MLKQEGLSFYVAVCGEKKSKYPSTFDDMKSNLKEELIHFGYCESFKDYSKLLWKSDIMPITSIQEFFGISVVEAMHCNVYPLLPNRLSYPSHIPVENQSTFLYDTKEELVVKLKSAIQNIEQIRKVKVNTFVKDYEWKNLRDIYDKTLSNLFE